MPRITEATVAEHVAKQETAISEAAIRLFTERGFSRVSLADIAAEVGLARTSLYRYYPRTSDILALWLKRELTERRRLSIEMLSTGGPVGTRIRDWAIDQLDYAQRPEHNLLATLPELLGRIDDETRSELGEAHRELLSPLVDVLIESGITDGSERRATAELIFGLVMAATRWEQQSGKDRRVRARLEDALRGLLASPE